MINQVLRNGLLVLFLIKSPMLLALPFCPRARLCCALGLTGRWNPVRVLGDKLALKIDIIIDAFHRPYSHGLNECVIDFENEKQITPYHPTFKERFG